MLFANEEDGTVVVGNRDPGGWLFGGPLSNDQLEICEAGSFKCIRGIGGVEPIVVGDMPAGVSHPFPALGLKVERSLERVGGCDKFVSTPVVAGDWRQIVVYCRGIGVAQVRVYKRGKLTGGLDLKSAEGLLGTGVVLRQMPPA